MPMKPSISVLALVAGASYAFGAPSPVGTWMGKITILPGKNMSEAQKKTLKKNLVMIKEDKLIMAVKKDGTYTATMTRGKQTVSKKGTWVLDGNAVSFFTTASSPPQKVLFSKTGKTMSFHLPPRNGVMSDFVFVRL